MAEKLKFYVVLAGEKITTNDDGSIEITFEAFPEDEEEPVKITLNFGDDVEDIVRLFTRIIATASAIREVSKDG